MIEWKLIELTQTEWGIHVNDDHRYRHQDYDIDDMRKHSSAIMNDILQRNLILEFMNAKMFGLDLPMTIHVRSADKWRWGPVNLEIWNIVWWNDSKELLLQITYKSTG